MQNHTLQVYSGMIEALDRSVGKIVKALEENGIGRPSTFASILATIVKREYVNRKSGKLSPTFLGLAVTQLLENHFTNLVSKEFTAKWKMDWMKYREESDNQLRLCIIFIMVVDDFKDLRKC